MKLLEIIGLNSTTPRIVFGGDSGGGGGGGASGGSAQDKINDIMLDDDYDGQWTSELNDLVAERDNTTNAGSSYTETPGNTTSSGNPIDTVVNFLNSGRQTPSSAPAPTRLAGPGRSAAENAEIRAEASQPLDRSDTINNSAKGGDAEPLLGQTATPQANPATPNGPSMASPLASFSSGEGEDYTPTGAELMAQLAANGQTDMRSNGTSPFLSDGSIAGGTGLSPDTTDGLNTAVNNYGDRAINSPSRATTFAPGDGSASSGSDLPGDNMTFSGSFPGITKSSNPNAASDRAEKEARLAAMAAEQTNPRIGYESGQDVVQSSPNYLTGLDGFGPNTVGQVDGVFYGDGIEDPLEPFGGSGPDITPTQTQPQGFDPLGLMAPGSTPATTPATVGGLTPNPSNPGAADPYAPVGGGTVPLSGGLTPNPSNPGASDPYAPVGGGTVPLSGGLTPNPSNPGASDPYAPVGGGQNPAPGTGSIEAAAASNYASGVDKILVETHGWTLGPDGKAMAPGTGSIEAAAASNQSPAPGPAINPATGRPYDPGDPNSPDYQASLGPSGGPGDDIITEPQTDPTTVPPRVRPTPPVVIVDPDRDRPPTGDPVDIIPPQGPGDDVAPVTPPYYGPVDADGNPILPGVPPAPATPAAPAAPAPAAPAAASDNSASYQAEIDNLRAQLALLTNSSTSETEGLTREQVMSMITSVMNNSNASGYNPAAFMNAFGFAAQPTYFGNTIPSYVSENGLYERRQVKDRDTGELKYVNVPIGNASLAGLSGFQKRRRAGFGRDFSQINKIS